MKEHTMHRSIDLLCVEELHGIVLALAYSAALSAVVRPPPVRRRTAWINRRISAI